MRLAVLVVVVVGFLAGGVLTVSGRGVWIYVEGELDLSFEELVTGKIVEVAVSDFAYRVKDWGAYAGRHGLDPVQYIMNDWVGVSRMAGYGAREAVFEARLGRLYYLDDGFDGEGGIREQVMEIAREALKDPDDLKARYMQYRDLVVDGLRQNGVAAIVRQILLEVRPYFGDVSEEQLTKIDCWRKLDAERRNIWISRSSNKPESVARLRKLEQKISDLGVTSSHVLAYEWAERRRAEGGDELVQAWGEIIDDLARCLE